MRLNNQFDQYSEGNSLVRTLSFIIISTVAIISSLIILLYNNKSLDKKINQCISNNTELIMTSNNLMLEIGNAQRRILALALTIDKSEQKDLIRDRELAISNSHKHHEEITKYIESNPLIPELSQISRKSNQLRKEYLKLSEHFILLLEKKVDETIISAYLTEKLTPKFKKYRLNQLKISESLNKQFIVESQSITKKSSTVVWVAFVIGVLPFVFLFKVLFNPK